MANAPAEATAPAVPVIDDSPVPLRGDVVEVYESMLASVPLAGQDGFEGIIAAIALATDPADLDAPWRSAGLEDWLNEPIVVTGIRKMESDYQTGLGWFLVIDGAVKATGEVLAITTGSVSVVAQLVKAHALGAFPLTVIPRQAERASAKGYFPQHLEIVRA